MDWILNNPRHSFKYLHYDLKGLKRVHIGHFVLVFKVDYGKIVTSFEDYNHHDKIYTSK
jgi:mRNA-degrading endonuclease RelE of RelBE toxin-antitoxin system